MKVNIFTITTSVTHALLYMHARTWVAGTGVGVYPVLTPPGIVSHARVAWTVIDVHAAVSASEPRGTVAGVVSQEVLSERRGRKCLMDDQGT